MLKRIMTKEGYELISVNEAAKLVGVTIGAVYNWMNDGRLAPMAMINDRISLFDKKAVIAAAGSCKKRKPRTGASKGQ